MFAKSRVVILFLAFFLLLSCQASFIVEYGDPLEHDISGSTYPWTHSDFDAPTDRMTFAVFSDLTGGERSEIFQIAVAQMNMFRPEFIMNVGDLVEGGTEDADQLDAQYDSFDARADLARAPIFYTGGNHDLNSMAAREFWEERYGRRYYHFKYKDVLFLILDTDDSTAERMAEIMALREEAGVVFEEQGFEAFAQTEYSNLPEDGGGAVSREQSEYFKKVIAENSDVRRVFLFMHKAPWQREDLTTFAEIEVALGDLPYTVFHGHRHAHKYLRRNGRDYIQLATTGGTQLPGNGPSFDQFVVVTLAGDEMEIVNLRMDGVLDKTGHIPLGGDEVCFESALCEE